MGSNPINLVIRFLLELSALMAMGFWGWNQGKGAFRFVLAFGIPIIAALVWGVFAVPDDPSRSGNALFQHRNSSPCAGIDILFLCRLTCIAQAR
jgi:hypothetical protein